MTFAKSAGVLGGSQFLNILLTLISRVILTRILGDVSFGQFNVALNAMTFVSRSSGLGIAPASQYFTSTNKYDPGAIIGTILPITILLSLSTTWLVFHFLGPITSSLGAAHPDSVLAFKVLLASLPILMITMVLGVLFVPLGLIKEFGILQAGAMFPMVIVALILTRYVSPIYAASYAQIATYCFLFLYMVYHLGKHVKKLSFKRELLVPLLSYSIKAWPNSILIIGVARFATLIGAVYMSSVELSYFALGLQITEGLLAPHQSLGQLILSKSASDPTAKIEENTALFLRLSAFLFLLVFLFIALLGYPGIYVLFGQKFLNAFPYLLALFFTGGAHALMRTFNNFSAGRGLPQYATIALLAELILLLSLIFTLGPRMGSWGVVWASGCSAFVGLAVSSWQFTRLTGQPFLRQFVCNREDIKYFWSQVKSQRPAS